MRPSPGAAGSGLPSALQCSGGDPLADIAAPGDGRTPVAVSRSARVRRGNPDTATGLQGMSYRSLDEGIPAFGDVSTEALRIASYQALN